MRFYFAPLEGITGYIYRNAHQKYFSGIDRYYSPFVVTRDGGIMKKKELRDILPENNQGIPLIPQILTNHSENFLHAAEQMRELGYQEVNLNLGCPSGTVSAKGRGAGFLRWECRTRLQHFLDEIFTEAQVNISVKTRIGWDDPEEFEDLLQLYNEYPICELTIHPRTRQEFYKGNVHRDAFALAYEKSKNPVCYNGDICTPEDYQELVREFPDLSAVMIGRGLLADPSLVGRIGGETMEKETLWEFYQTVFSEYQKVLSGDTPLLFKMKELWIYMASLFTDYEKYLKKIKKTHHMEEYQLTVRRLFEEQELRK